MEDFKNRFGGNVLDTIEAMIKTLKLQDGNARMQDRMPVFSQMPTASSIMPAWIPPVAAVELIPGDTYLPVPIWLQSVRNPPTHTPPTTTARKKPPPLAARKQPK